MASWPTDFAADPSYRQEAEAAERGLDDLLFDLRRQSRQSRRERRGSARDIRREGERAREDLRTTRQRALQDVRYQRQDVRQGAGRTIEDFNSQLTNMIRNFGILGNNQLQTAASQGVADRGTLAAGDAKRAENLAIARQPIDTGIARTQEDLATSLGRLSTQAGEIRQDFRTGRQRVRQDVRHDIRLGKRDLHSLLRDVGIRRQRGIREERIGRGDLLEQAIFDAQQRNPGQFTDLGGGGHKKRRP
jgi:hypothetical protein